MLLRLYQDFKFSCMYQRIRLSSLITFQKNRMQLKHKLYCHTLGCKMGFAVKGIVRLLKKRFEEEDVELTLEQYYILNILNNEDDLILQELAEIVERDKSAVLRLIDGLEENHFVARSKDPDDKRRKVLVVTKPGVEVLNKAIALDKKVNDEITNQLSQKKMEELEEALSIIYEKTILNIED